MFRNVMHADASLNVTPIGVYLQWQILHFSMTLCLAVNCIFNFLIARKSKLDRHEVFSDFDVREDFSSGLDADGIVVFAVGIDVHENESPDFGVAR